MFRVARISSWRRKKPRVGQSFARRTRCQSDHSHRSGLEAKTCDELLYRKKAGNAVPPDPNGIRDYDVEYRVRLCAGGYSWNHYVDFRTHDLDGGHTFVEAKGIEWPEWKKNWGILQEMYMDDPMVRFLLVKK